ncbi:unnamed protein product [Owenia fusiformis]|uniref:Uncharacterized protein n=1 Tax=Owenia fusiformis TaxID=6347 RepID=A0A8J1U8Y7_OWEFU|nr:unnamed protein product [Owenia fusiformis]
MASSSVHEFLTDEEGNLEQIINNLEFEVQQYMQLIEKEQQHIDVLQKDVEVKHREIDSFEKSTAEINEETKRLHKQFVWNRENCESLKKTTAVLSEHEDALNKKLGELVAKHEQEREGHEAVLSHYEQLWGKYQEKYESFDHCKELAEKKAELRRVERTIEEADERITDLTEQMNQLQTESESDDPLYENTNDFVVKVAELKVDITRLAQEEAKYEQNLAENEETIAELRNKQKRVLEELEQRAIEAAAIERQAELAKEQQEQAHQQQQENTQQIPKQIKPTNPQQTEGTKHNNQAEDDEAPTKESHKSTSMFITDKIQVTGAAVPVAQSTREATTVPKSCVVETIGPMETIVRRSVPPQIFIPPSPTIGTTRIERETVPNSPQPMIGLHVPQLRHTRMSQSQTNKSHGVTANQVPRQAKSVGIATLSTQPFRPRASPCIAPVAPVQHVPHVPPRPQSIPFSRPPYNPPSLGAHSILINPARISEPQADQSSASNVSIPSRSPMIQARSPMIQARSPMIQARSPMIQTRSPAPSPSTQMYVPYSQSQHHQTQQQKMEQPQQMQPQQMQQAKQIQQAQQMQQHYENQLQQQPPVEPTSQNEAIQPMETCDTEEPVTPGRPIPTTPGCEAAVTPGASPSSEFDLDRELEKVRMLAAGSPGFSFSSRPMFEGDHDMSSHGGESDQAMPTSFGIQSFFNMNSGQESPSHPQTSMPADSSGFNFMAGGDASSTQTGFNFGGEASNNNSQGFNFGVSSPSETSTSSQSMASIFGGAPTTSKHSAGFSIFGSGDMTAQSPQTPGEGFSFSFGGQITDSPEVKENSSGFKLF